MNELIELLRDHFGGFGHWWLESESPGGFLKIGCTPEGALELLAHLSDDEQAGRLADRERREHAVSCGVGRWTLADVPVGTRVRNQDLPPGSPETGTMTGTVIEHDGPFVIVEADDGHVWDSELPGDLTILDREGEVSTR